MRAAISRLEGQVRTGRDGEPAPLGHPGGADVPLRTRSPRPSRKSVWESSLPRKDWDALAAAVAGLEERKQGFRRGCFAAAAGNGRPAGKKRASGTAAAGRAGSGTGTERPGGGQAAKPAVHRPTGALAWSGRPQSLREREREVTAQRENVGRELARLQERSDNLQKEYDAHHLPLWEEYELTRREAEEVARADRGPARRPAPPGGAEKQDQGPGRGERGRRGGVPRGVGAVCSF